MLYIPFTSQFYYAKVLIKKTDGYLLRNSYFIKKGAVIRSFKIDILFISAIR